MSRCQASNLFDYQFTRKDYLQINIFPDPVVVEQEGDSHALQKKATEGVTSEIAREMAG